MAAKKAAPTRARRLAAARAREAARAAGVFCPGCGKPLADTSRNVHEGCPEDPRLWVSVPPPS